MGDRGFDLQRLLLVHYECSGYTSHGNRCYRKENEIRRFPVRR